MFNFTFPTFNKEHVAWLREGTASWNERRKEQNFFIPCFDGADLKKELLGAQHPPQKGLLGWIPGIKCPSLEGIDLNRANFRQASLDFLDLKKADLANAQLQKSLLIGTELRDANLSGADLSEADLFSADLTGANLSNANLTSADLTGAKIADADFTDAKLADRKSVV